METEVSYRPAALFLAQADPPSSSQWALTGQRMAIGRDPASDVHLDDSRISWHHADLICHGLTWSIADARSTNGTFVNGARVHESVLQPRDRIRLGEIEFIVKDAGPAGRRGPATTLQASPGQRARPGTGPQGGPVSYDVGWQEGNINNVAGDQANYYHESNLRYIASKRGRARALIVWGIVLFFLGNGLAGYAVYQYDQKIFDIIASSSASSGPPDIPTPFFPLIGLGTLLALLGLAMFIFGLIARSGAKKEARRLGAYRK